MSETDAMMYEVPGSRLREVTEIIMSLRRVLAERELELLELKGLCSNPRCRLHDAHSGPCEGQKLPYTTDDELTADTYRRDNTH